MKRILLFVLFIPGLLLAQTTHNVTFKVDMNQYYGTYGTVYVNGTFNGWAGTANPLSDADGDGVWEAVLPIADDTIEYKFTLDGWTFQEEFVPGGSCTVTNGGFTNRSLISAVDTVLDVVCYNSCSACPNPIQDQIDLPVTFDDPMVSNIVTPFGGSLASVVTDPAGGTNNVLMVDKPLGAQSWAGVTFGDPGGFASPIPFSATSNVLTLMTYSPDSGVTVRLKVEDASDPTVYVEVDATTTVSNAWETLTFDMTNPATTPIDYNNTYDKASVFFNFLVDPNTVGAKTYYCDNLMMPAPPYVPSPCGDLFISEYIEGGGSNKGLELYNPTANSIDLSNYTLHLIVNGGSFINTTQPTGTIAAYGTYTLVNSNADSVLASLADTLVAGFSAVNFNGDDAVILTKGSDTVDVIGVPLVDPGSSWTVGSGSTQNHTLVRMASVDMGETDWAVGSTQWDVYPQDTFTDFGMHTSNCFANPCIITMLPFTEDFEAGFPSCWDTTQNAGSVGFLHGDATSLSSAFLTFPAHTNFVASNDDACNCDMSNDLLRTPQFDLTNYAGDIIELSFEYFNNQEYDSYGTVWYSMNGGPIMFLDSMPETLTSGAWESMTIDVSATAGSDSVVFIFKHDDSGPGNWGDGVAIDDVMVAVGVDPCIITTLPFTEDFESGFPACWDTTQNAGSVGFLHGDATSLSSAFLTFPAHTNFVASNDDACNCDMSNDLLRTPQFDLTNYAGDDLDLTFEYFNNQEYDSYGTVWYSMNGGPIMFLDSMPETLTSGAWESMTIDVSATAGSDSVVFIFKHDDSGPGNWGDGVAIDDVTVAVAVDPCIITTLPYTEDFEAGFPACWDTTQNAGSVGFLHGDATSLSSAFLTFPAHTNFMASNDDACNCDMSNDLLRTPQFDLSSYAGQSLSLSFEYFNNQEYDSYGTVWYSMDGGPLMFLDSMPETLTSNAWQSMNLDVSATAGSDSVVFVFKHDDSGPGNWADGVAIDDVVVDIADTDSDVTFRVDMNAYGSAFGYVNVSGTFNSWCGDCAQMSDADGDGVWELTVSNIPNGPIEWKYSIDNWATDESLTPGMSCVVTNGGFTNRYMDVQADTTMPVVCYESCAACPANPINVDITFQVDMDGYTGGAYTNVDISGTFNGWCGGCATMADPDGDNVYDITLTFTNIIPGDTIEWKYNLDAWTDQENLTDGDPCTLTTIDGTNTFINRMLELPAMDMTLPVVCWNSCDACPSIGLEEEAGAFTMFPNPTSDNVTLTWTSTEDRTIRIIDAQGRIVQTLTSTANEYEVTLDVSGLTAGWYTVAVESASNYQVEKLIIQE